MKKILKKILTLVEFSVLLLFFCLIFSCQTIKVADMDPFSAIGEGADIYIYFPVEGNEKFAKAVLGKYFEEKDFQMAMSRTKKIYAGIFSGSKNSKNDDEILACAVGSYPANMSGSIFKEKNGWKKHLYEKSIVYYIGRENAVSIPNNKNTFFVLSNKPANSMERFLKNGVDGKIVPFSESFNLFINNTHKNAISVVVKNPNFILAKIIGFDLQLPVKDSEFYLIKKDNKDFYSYNFSMESDNKMTAFALSLVLQRVLNADVRTYETVVYVENGKLTNEDLVNILKKISE